MAEITRADIENAINAVTGEPTSGILKDVTPGLVDAIDKLVNPKLEQEQRIVKAAETRKSEHPEQ